MPISGLGLPGRHDAGGGDRGDLHGALLGIFIGEKGEGRYFAGAMAGGAVVIEDGRDVTIESRDAAASGGGDGGENGGEKREFTELHQLTPGMAHPITLVTGTATGFPSKTASNASRR